MILGNASIYNFNPHRHCGAFGNQYTNYKPSTRYLAYFPDTTSTSTMSGASFPTGTQPPYSWLLAPKGGELSSTTYIGGTGSVTSNLLSGKLMTADLAGSGDISASLSLVTSLIASLSGSGSISANLKTTLSMAASLAGSGDLAGSLSMLMEFTASLSGTGAITANLKGNMDMEATIYVNQSEATVQQIVDAIWNAVATDYNASGTMGNKLNGAGSAGDPWTTDLSSYTTDGTAGKILQDAKKKAALAASLSA